MTTSAPALVPPTGMVRWIGFFALLFGNFIAILDIQIVASSLIEVQAGLSATREEISWIQTGYLIAEVIAIPLSGYLARMMSTRYYFATCALVFTLASMACAGATSIEEMVFWRVLQGFSGGGMIPTSFAAMFIMFKPDERTLGLVLIGLVATSAPAFGPVLGGYITGMASWHWLFLINLVPGLLVTVLVLRFVRIDEPQWQLAKVLDVLALVTMSLFLGSLEYIVEEGQGKGWFDDRHIVWAAVICLFSGSIFVWRSLTRAEPLVDLRTFTDRNFLLGGIFGFILGAALYSVTYLLPLFLGQVSGYNALKIGETLIVTGITMFFAAPLSGGLSRVMDLRLVMLFGVLFLTSAMYLLAQLTVHTGYDQLVLPQVLMGVGIMFWMVPLSELAMGTLRLDQMQNASGLFNLMRNLGGAIGLGVLTTVLSDQNHLHAARLGEDMDRYALYMDGAIQQGAVHSAVLPGSDGALLSFVQLAKMMYQQALVMAFNDTLLACSIAFALAVFMVPLFRKVINSGEPGAMMH